jgi:hypothetical protein
MSEGVMTERKASVVDAMSQVESGIRDAVLKRVSVSPTARDELASQLDMPQESVDRMLARERWDLGLAFKLADKLGMELHVAASQG